MKHLDRVGLLLNTHKTVVITNEAQPPQTFVTTAGVILRVLPRDAGQKWLGSMLTSRGSKLQDVDVQYNLQQASKVFHMNRWILQDRNVSIVKRLRYFESVVSSVACFAGGHRTMYNRHLERLDTHFRKLCRSIVGPPPGTDWTLEWHETLHQWNVRMNMFLDRANINFFNFFFFPRTFFLALGLVGAVLLGSFQACAIYIPAAPDVQGNRAKSKPLLLRGGLGRGWRWGGGWLQPAPRW